jgi:hypothetical protein
MGPQHEPQSVVRQAIDGTGQPPPRPRGFPAEGRGPSPVTKRVAVGGPRLDVASTSSLCAGAPRRPVPAEFPPSARWVPRSLGEFRKSSAPQVSRSPGSDAFVPGEMSATGQSLAISPGRARPRPSDPSMPSGQRRLDGSSTSSLRASGTRRSVPAGLRSSSGWVPGGLHTDSAFSPRPLPTRFGDPDVSCTGEMFATGRSPAISSGLALPRPSDRSVPSGRHRAHPGAAARACAWLGRMACSPLAIAPVWLVTSAMKRRPRRNKTPDGPLSRFLLDRWEVLREIAEWALAALRVSLIVAGVVLLVVLFVMVLRRLRDRQLRASARRIRILPPPDLAGAPGSEMFWMSLHSLLRPWWRRALFGQPHLAWEVVARPEHVEISLWMPARVPIGTVERAVEGAWPGSRAIDAGDAGPAIDRSPEGAGMRRYLEVDELRLTTHERLPIGTPGPVALGLVLAGLTGLSDGEAALIQVAARPATSGSRRRLLKAAQGLRVGARRARRAAGDQMRYLHPAIEQDVRSVLQKASSPLWHCQVRVGVDSPIRKRARGRMHGLAGGFGVFEGANGFRQRRAPGAARRARARVLGRGYLLSVPELAQIATLPAAGAVEGLERAGAGTVAPSRDLPSVGKILGRAQGPGARPVAVSVEDARHHLHVMGETGTGKSTLLARLVLQDAEAGRSAVVVDPKGDLITAILQRLPPGAEARTCLVDPDDPERAVGLDLLTGKDRDLAVEHVLGVFRRIYEQWWGPRTDDIMRAACLTLTRIPGATLVDVPLLLTDAGWRRNVREHLQDRAGLGAFWSWYERLPEAQRATHIAPLLNKLRAFVLRGPVRAIVGQDHPRLDVGRLLDTGGLLLVRIPKGTLGDDTSRLLGALAVARVWQACMERASRDERQRPDTALYVDEMHNYLALPRSFEDILAEARGYRLSLVLAHQHLGQLPRDMRDALAANARTKVCFATSPEDAFVLEHHFSPQLTSHDLSHLRAFQAACRPCVSGGHGSAFTFTTDPLDGPIGGREGAVREASARRFARDRDRVELDINRRHERIEAGHHPLPERDGGRADRVVKSVVNRSVRSLVNRRDDQEAEGIEADQDEGGVVE